MNKTELEKQIDKILRSYWFDPYAKEQYIKNVTKKLMELWDESKKGKKK